MSRNTTFILLDRRRKPTFFRGERQGVWRVVFMSLRGLTRSGAARRRRRSNLNLSS